VIARGDEFVHTSVLYICIAICCRLCGVLQCVAECCCVLQSVAVYCRVLQCVAEWWLCVEIALAKQGGEVVHIGVLQ